MPNAKRLIFPILLLVIVMITSAGCRENRSADLLRIGLTEEPKTLNIWLASDRNSRKILSLIYQPLYNRDPDTLEQIPWLAAEPPAYDPESLCYTVKLKPARWSDGTAFTSSDVAFTANLIKEFKIPRHSSRWRFVDKIETPDPHTVKFYLKSAKAIFVSRSLSIPIVQEKEWQPRVAEARQKKKPLAALLNVKIDNPVGSGPFVVKEWRPGAYLHLQRNDHFFGRGRQISGRTLGPFVEDVVFKIYGTSDVAVLALKKASIDMFWWGIQPGYIDDLENAPHIRLHHNQKSALYFMGFNLRQAPFNDLALRRAVAALVDKDFIVARILQGHGVAMYSVVPAENRLWYCDQVPRFAEGLNREERIKLAHGILEEAGYSWEVAPVDAAGQVQPASGIRFPSGEPMDRVTILTPPADYDPLRAMSGMMIQEWLRMLGLPVYARPMSFSSLLDQVKTRREFDAFILGYGNLSLDPDYVRTFFYSKNNKPRGWNMSGYNNSVFDRLAKESASAMDHALRRELILEMQMVIMNDLPYLPLYKPSVIEAVRTDRFDGWLDTLEGIGNIWSYCLLKPVGDTSTQVVR